MMKFYTWATLIFLSSISVLKAQVAVTAPNQTYNQDFNTLDTAGATNAFNIAGWEISRDTYRASNGSANNGDVYSFGETNSTDRALGGIPSSSVSRVYIGASFKNTSGESLNELSIQYKGEQWRRSDKRTKDTSTPLPDTLVFEYSTNATEVNDQNATWKKVSSLNFISPIVSDTVIVLDGNLAENSKSISGKFNTNLTENSTVYVRWVYIRNTSNISGSRDGLAIDDLSVTFKFDPTWEDSTSIPCEYNFEEIATITEFENTTSSFSLTFDEVEGASGYIITLDKVESEDHEFGYPLDGDTYTVGDYIGDTKVVAITTENIFTYDDLTEFTGYYVNIFPFYNCEESIFYGEEEYFEFYAVETCDYPDFFTTKILNVSANSTSAEVTLMKVKDAVGYIILLDQQGGEYGEPEVGESYNIGDFINDSKVVYVGNSLTASIDGLEPMSVYEIFAYPIFDCEDEINYGFYIGTEFTTTTVTSIKETISNNLLIYPNPTAGNVLNLRLNNVTPNKATIQIFNIVGSQVYNEQRIASSNMQLTLPNQLATGRYTIRIEQDGNQTIGSFVIVR
ncbi:MAG TPA: T9SS type A sorting domain-containing protein [Chitinophagales bacterium]|nr:T9SS type A sorting domain-containing protein [Chitinophagales bacterium]